MKSLKKMFAAFFCAAVAVTAVLGFAACSDEKSEYSVYMPDGAPALAMAQLMAEDMGFGHDVSYSVVDSSLIQTYVTGETPKADVCILPVNAAALLLGSGETYKMLGTVTHGNLFLLSKTEDEIINSSRLSSLVGKTVGVVNLSAVPGLTFKLILNEAGISYTEPGNSGSVSTDKVNLYAIEGAEVGVADYDYYIAPEPAATTKVNAIEALNFVGSLQDLYGSEGGYPQAVIVAKTSVIENDPEFISDLIAAVEANADWLTAEDTSMETVVNAVSSHLTEGMTPTFTAKNLNAQVIENCAIRFVASTECREEVLSFLAKYEEVSSQTFSVSDSFFYGYVS